MTVLRRRLERLEKTIEIAGPSFAEQFHLVNETAFAKMSVADLDLLQGRTKLTGFEHTKAWAEVSSRWEAAFEVALCETNCPFYICAWDWGWL